MIPIQLAVEVEDVGATTQIYFSVNGRRFASTPGHTRYVDLAEDIGVEILRKVLLKLLIETGLPIEELISSEI